MAEEKKAPEAKAEKKVDVKAFRARKLKDINKMSNKAKARANAERLFKS